MPRVFERYSGKKRLAACTPWVKAMLSSVFGLEKAVQQTGLRFVVIDGSTVQEPGATETTYRLHIAIDLINLTLRQVELTTDKIGEHLDHYLLESGDVVLIDRGYNQPKSLVPFLDRGGDIVLRYNPHSMNLFEKDETGKLVKIDWESRLKRLGHPQAAAIPVVLCHGHQSISATVHAIRLPPEKIAEARRKTRERARKKGREVSEKALYLGDWVFILTTLSTELIDTETAGALYRVRWQVELLIKRMKSLLAIDQLRARKDSALAELYLYGKLLYAAVLEKISQRRFFGCQRRLDLPRHITDWRLWTMIANEIKAALQACFPLRAPFKDDCLKSLRERPRKRHLQTLPKAVINLLSMT